jgi:hypothetical protein
VAGTPDTDLPSPPDVDDHLQLPDRLHIFRRITSCSISLSSDRSARKGQQSPRCARKAGISEASFYVWRKKYGALLPSKMNRLKQPEEEISV